MSFGANVNLGGEIYPKSIGYVWDALGMSYVPAQQIVGGPGGLTIIADGGDAAQGATTDPAWVSGNGTVIALLKRIASGGGSAVSIVDGGDATQGAKADAAWDGSAASPTLVAIQKYLGQKIEAVRALLAGTLTVGLPSGASTAAKQDTGNAALASIDGKLATPLPVTGPLTDAALRASPVPVSLPGGLATSANQATEILGLSSIDTKLTGVALDGTDTSASAMPAGGVGIRGWLSAIYTKLAASIAVTGAFWQATQPVSIAAAVAVTGVFWQATQPVSGTVALDAATLAALEFTTIDASALPLNAAQETGGNLDTLVARTVPGQALMDDSLPVTLASDQQTMESRVDRRAQEDALVQGLDLAAFALATRSRFERVSLTDRRGRSTRGTSR